MARSNMYISVSNDSGTDEAMRYNRFLIKKIREKSEDIHYKVPGLFQQDLFKEYIADMKFAKGILGLQNGFAFWSDKFVWNEKFNIHILPVRSDDVRFNLAILEFQSDKQKEVFLEQNGLQFAEDLDSGQRTSDSSSEYWWNFGMNKLIFLESSSPMESSEKHKKIIEKFLSG
jgi:hypothetical protein